MMRIRSAEIWNALRCTEAVNPGDCFGTPVFTGPTGMAKALKGRLENLYNNSR